MGEIRTRSERMHAFADTSAVEAALQRLADKFPPLAMQLPRAPGTKEARWTHLLAGEPDLDALATAEAAPAGGSLSARVAALEAEVQALREELAAFKRQFE